MIGPQASDSNFHDEENINTRTILIIILLIAFLIISWGVFFKKFRYEQIAEKERIRRRIDELDRRITILKAKKDQIIKREKKILLLSRVLTGIFLICINIITQYDYNFPDFERISSINGSIILAYSFVGFILFGSIKNMISVLKAKVAYIMRKNHLSSLEELEIFIRERNDLRKKLEAFKDIPDSTINIDPIPDNALN